MNAINKISDLITSTNAWAKLKTCTWIPIPPSKINTDPEYDDRLIQVVKKLEVKEKTLDIREMLLSKANREAAHIVVGKMRTIEDHLDNLTVNTTFKDPLPTTIIIFDDVITSGATFKAAQKKLRELFPKTPIAGIFVARNIKVESSLEDLTT